MKRILFLVFVGLVLGEAAAIQFGWKGICFSVFTGLFPLFFFLMSKKEGGRYSVLLSKQPKIKTMAGLLALSMVFGFLLYMHAWDVRDPLPKETVQGEGAGSASVKLPADGEIRGRISYLKKSKEGNYTVTLSNAEFSGETFRGFFQEDSKEEAREEDEGNVEEILWEDPENYDKKDNVILLNNNQFISIRGDCRITGITEGELRLYPGDRIFCAGTLKALEEPTNPGEFNSALYYRADGISCQFFSSSCTLTGEAPFSAARAAYCVKERIRAVYHRVMPEDKAALFIAMILGDKSELSEEQKDLYEENGAAHLLAVSGLHVSIVAGSWFRFLRRRKVRYLFCCGSGALLLIFYGCMTGFGSSVTRAAIMYAVYLGSEYFSTEYDMISAMGLAGILMLAESPWRLLEGGFQISFTAIFALGYVLPFVKEKIQERQAGRRAAAEGEIRRFPRVRQKGKEALIASLVLTVVTLPVILHVFYSFSPYSVFLNLLIIPCMTPLMFSALIGGIAGLLHFIPTVFVRLLMLPAGVILSLFSLVFSLTARLPGVPFVTGCPSLYQILLFYGLAAVLFALWLKRRWRVILSSSLALFALFLCFPREQKLRIVMLDIGQGDCIYIKMPGGESLLVDGGSTSRSKVGQYVIEPALKYYGENHLDYVIISHGDEDHISGVEELLEKGYPIRHLILQKGQEEDENLKTLISLADEEDSDVVFMEREDQILFKTGSATVLHPYSDFYTDDRNEASLVFHLNYKEFDALFTGDLELAGEEAFVSWLSEQEETVFPDLELLKVGHHGSRNATSEDFLELTDPQLALISAGRGNRYGHPHEETLERLKERGVITRQTKENGAICVESDGVGWKLSVFLDGIEH